MAWLKKVLTWLVKELAKAAIAPVTAWLVGGVAVLLPAVLLWFQTGLAFLVTYYQVQGWFISVVASLWLFALFLLVRQGVVSWQQRGHRRITYSWGNLEWSISPDIRSDYKYTSVKSSYIAERLDLIIRGPFCPHCKRELNSVFLSNEKCSCGHTFKLGIIKTVRLDVIRAEVYMQAQAAARRNEL